MMAGDGQQMKSKYTSKPLSNPSGLPALFHRLISCSGAKSTQQIHPQGSIWSTEHTWKEQLKWIKCQKEKKPGLGFSLLNAVWEILLAKSKSSGHLRPSFGYHTRKGCGYTHIPNTSTTHRLPPPVLPDREDSAPALSPLGKHP